MKASVGEVGEVPSGFVTVTLTVPADCAGESTASCWFSQCRTTTARTRGFPSSHAGAPPAGPLTAGSLCSGYGGLDLAVMAVTGARLAWMAETDRHAAAVLAHHWPDVPNLGDITALDWAAVPPVDLVSAGWPCQDISYAGPGAGITEGTRSGLWLHIAAGLRHLRPGYVFLENVAALRTRGLGRVLADLAALVSAFLSCLGCRGSGPSARACGLR